MAKLLILIMLLSLSLQKKPSKNTKTIIEKPLTQKALVILDDWMMIETHSMFWDQIKSSRYELTFKMMDDPNIQLDYFGERLFDSIILCVPSMTEEEAKESEISIKKIINYFDDGHNLMILADKHVKSYIRSLVTEFGLDFDDYDSQVKDSLYLYNHKSAINEKLLNMRTNEIIVTKNILPIKNVFHSPNNFILFEGIGMEIDSHNGYAFSVLKADENSYSIIAEDGNHINVGDRIKLVAAYQGRNNKRVIITGGSSLCSNRFYFLSMFNNNSPLESSNAVFCQDLINWNFERTGVLKFDNIKHQKVGETEALERYRVKDDIEYMIDIYEYDYVDHLWKPYLTDDLQIVFSLMEPFYRVQMKLLSSEKPTYYTSLKVSINIKT